MPKPLPAAIAPPSPGPAEWPTTCSSSARRGCRCRSHTLVPPRRDSATELRHQPMRAESSLQSSFLPLVFFTREPEDVAGLARERLADRVERRKADRARLAGLQDREVGQRHSDAIRELGQRHPPVVQYVVELDGDQTVPSRSSRMRVPSANTRASRNVRSTASQPLIEKPASILRGCAGVETALAIAPMTMLRSCSVKSAQAVACKRSAFAATNGSPARTVSTIASSRLR